MDVSVPEPSAGSGIAGAPASGERLAIALLQIAAAGYDQAANLERGVAACRRAASLGADVALFPELWNIGHAFEDGDIERWRAQALPRDGNFVRRFASLAAELQMAIAITYLERRAGAPRNTLTLFDRRGREVLTYAKLHPCGFDSPEAMLEPGDRFVVAPLDTAVGSLAVGAMICFDREFPEAARVLALEGAELVLVPNACEMESNRLGQLRSRAFENMVAVALANYPAPAQNGHSVVYDPIAFDAVGVSRDTCVVEAGAGEDVVVSRLDLAALREWRRREVWGAAWRRPSAYGPLVQPGSSGGMGTAEPDTAPARLLETLVLRLTATSVAPTRVRRKTVRQDPL